MKEAIVLAGGFGTRLRQVVNDVPKPMASINGRPFLAYLLDYLGSYGFDHIILSTGYMHEKIEEYFGNTYQPSTPNSQRIAISYAQETTPLGTGGGILNALQYCHNDVMTVLNGDTMFKVDYSELDQFHAHHCTNLSIILRHVPDTARYGSVSIANDGEITHFTEKSAANGPGWINGGIYRLSKTLFSGFKTGEKFSFEKDVMEGYYRQQKFYAYPSNAYFIDIGVPDDYLRAQSEL